MRHAALALLVVVACTPRAAPQGQLLIVVDTDALLPATPSSRAEGPVFDALRVDVYAPGVSTPCNGCSRTFSLDAERLKRGDLSFGVPLPPATSGWRARLRMFPSFGTLSGAPAEYDDGPATSVVETVVKLPPVAETGIVERAVFLPIDAIGAPIGTLDEPKETLEGRFAKSSVGTWPLAKRTPCKLDPGPGEVCIEGGAFWMGNARMTDSGLGDGNDRLRLVVVSPFFIDSTEITVSAFRDTNFKPTTTWSGNSSGFTDADYCSYSARPDRMDLPMNCIDFDTARLFCEARGAHLPTEAQYEFVSGATVGRLYVWGDHDPSCSDAVLERAGYGIFEFLPRECKGSAPPGGPAAVGNIGPPKADRFETPHGTVYDLVGNVSELALDTWSRQIEPCWAQPGIFVDPVCTTPTTIDTKFPHTIRGASFTDEARLGLAAHRNGVEGGWGPRIGFRCARAATE